MYTALNSRQTRVFISRRIILVIANLLLTPLPLAAQIDADTIVPNRYLIVYRDATIPGDAEARARAVGAQILQRNDRFGLAVVNSTLPPLSPRSTAAIVEQDAIVRHHLAALPGVEYVLHDRIVSASHIILRPAIHSTFSVVIGPIHLHPIGPTHGPSQPEPSPPLTPPFDTFYQSSQGWAVRQVGGYGNGVLGGPTHGPWDTTTGKGVRIAILDSGIDSTHPDLAPNLALNISEVDQSPVTGLPSPCDDGTPQDQEGHGTWTASLAAAALGPGTGEVIGVAPAATLLNIKVLQRMPATIGGSATLSDQCTAGQASGLLSWLIQGIQDAMANRADIISMSLGTVVDLNTGEGAGIKVAFDRITSAAAQSGIVLVAAAGNEGYDLSNPRFVELPAQARDVLAIVASTNQDCAENLTIGAICAPGPSALAYYSNYGAPSTPSQHPVAAIPQAATPP